MLPELEIVLVNTRFPENIGMAARACANFGCKNICLVKPEKKDLLNAIPLATPKGLNILKNIRFSASLSEAVSCSNIVYGTTARTGGWRKAIQCPDEAAEKMVTYTDQKISLVFGSEDRGLINSDIMICDYLVHIPTTSEATSLNLAQAVLIMLYEYSKAAKKQNIFNKMGINKESPDKLITNKDKERLLEAFKIMLLEIDGLHGDNPDYFMLQWKEMFAKAQLKRNQYDALMGLCRQVHNKLKRDA